MPGGRPSDYTPELAEAICEAIASTPKGLERLCAEREDFPEARTVFRWLEAHEEFRHRYARAKERQGEVCAFRSLGVLEDAEETLTSRDDGPRGQNVLEQSKTYRWLAERLAPKKWAETKRQEVSGPDGGPVRTEEAPDLSPLSDEEVREWRRLKQKAEGAGGGGG